MLLAALLAACAAAEPVYEGERRDRGEVAVVTGLSPLGPLGAGLTARIEAVDGQPLEGGRTRVELLPGRHEFLLRCSAGGTSGIVTTSAELRAGEVYVVALGLGPEGELDSLILRP